MTPTNPLVGPLLTDLYQVTMAYAYWKGGRGDDHAVFELFFRRNPFDGEYSIYAGLRECLAYLENFRFEKGDIDYLRSLPSFSHAEEGFWEWLATVDASALTVVAMEEGTPAFPRIPLLRVEGPLAVAQLVETALLNLTGFATLIATNAARMRHVTGDSIRLSEFGLRRAQGPDGAITATRSAIIGGFDSTSNVLAGMLTGVPVSGTHAHAFVQSYTGLDDSLLEMTAADGTTRNIASVLKSAREQDGLDTNDGELAAFLAYAHAFPTSTLLLVDTYDTLASGVPNAIRVFKVLRELGYDSIGIRLDSGDLAYLSREARRMLDEAGFPDVKIVASNSINEQVLISLLGAGARIDIYGVGTNLVTAEHEPALGAVYKLVEINGEPRIKISQDREKVTIPGRKNAYRLSGSGGVYLADVLTMSDEEPPRVGEPYLCRHPAVAENRVRIIPSAVQPLHRQVFANGRSLVAEEPVTAIRDRSRELQKGIREDHRRSLNPTPYKVSLSSALYDYMYELWEREASIRTIE